MVNKKDLQVEINKQKAINENLQKQVNNLQGAYNKLLNANDIVVGQNKNLQTELNNEIMKNPYTNLTLESLYSSPYVDSNVINTNMSIMTKQKLAGLSSDLEAIANGKQSNSGVGGNSVWFSYLFILERAKYFMSCCQIESRLDNVVNEVYLALYYGSLNGTIGFTMDKNGCYLFYITKKKLDKYGKVEYVEGTTFNYHNSADFKEEEIKLPGEQVAIFDFNNEDFGLWVLAWDYVNKLYPFLQIAVNQATFLNKRFVLRMDGHNSTLRSQISQMLRQPGILIWMDNNVDLKQLETPDFDLNQIWQWIENYTNYFDSHFLNMRVKDLDDSNKERDIASQQSNHQTSNDNKSQFVDYFIDKFIHEINAKFNTDLKWHNRMIAIDDGITDQTKTLNKLKGGDENEQHTN